MAAWKAREHVEVVENLAALDELGGNLDWQLTQKLGDAGKPQRNMGLRGSGHTAEVPDGAHKLTMRDAKAPGRVSGFCSLKDILVHSEGPR